MALADKDIRRLRQLVDTGALAAVVLNTGSQTLDLRRPAAREANVPPQPFHPMRAPQPGRLALSVGKEARLRAGEVVATLAVGGTRTDVCAEIAGTVAMLLCDDGAFVEFGQPLLMIAPDAAQRNPR